MMSLAGMPAPLIRGMRLMATRRRRCVSRQISMEPKPPVASVSSGWYRLSSSRELVPSKGTSGENRAVCCEKSGMANPRAFKVRLRVAGAEPSRSRWHRCC